MAERYRDFKKLGIHTRLQRLIDKSGGYDVDYSANLLSEEYGIKDYNIAYEMAKNENIRDEIDAVGLERVIELIRESIRLRYIRFEQTLQSVSKMSTYGKIGRMR